MHGSCSGDSGKRMPLPNFLIIGAQKAGTSWLHKLIQLQPGAFMSSPKELNYFNRPASFREPESIEWYARNFDGSEGAQIVGESTPGYFWHREDRPGPPIPERVFERLGQPFIVVLLRDPVDRAVSAYVHHLYHGRISEGTRIIDADPALGILDMGHYKRHLEAWVNVFGQQRLRILFYEDISSVPHAVANKALRGTGVSLVDTSLLHRRVNARERIRSRLGAPEECVQFKEGELRDLSGLYMEDFEYVSWLTGRDLTVWKAVQRLA